MVPTVNDNSYMGPRYDTSKYEDLHYTLINHKDEVKGHSEHLNNHINELRRHPYYRNAFHKVRMEAKELRRDLGMAKDWIEKNYPHDDTEAVNYFMLTGYANPRMRPLKIEKHRRERDEVLNITNMARRD
jgi:hypothetical protein